MRTVLRWALRLVVALVVAGAMVAAGVYVLSEQRMAARFEVEPALPPLPKDPETLARGAHLAAIRGCQDCHERDLGGRVFIDDAPFARLAGTNLTRGRGGVAADRSDADLVRAIRHGVGHDGRPLLFMPSQEFNGLSEADMGALVSYIRSVPPVDREPPPNRVGPIGRALFLLGDVPLLPAELIDHAAAPAPAPEAGTTPEFGAYLATGCTGCHGAGFSGGHIPGTPPSWPDAANLTLHETGLAGWSEQDLRRALREGVRPNGSRLQTQFMPVDATKHMTDEEIGALWAFLSSLPPTPKGGR